MDGVMKLVQHRKNFNRNTHRKNEGAPSIVLVLHVGGPFSSIFQDQNPLIAIFRLGSSIGIFRAFLYVYHPGRNYYKTIPRNNHFCNISVFFL